MPCGVQTTYGVFQAGLQVLPIEPDELILQHLFVILSFDGDKRF